METKEKSTTKQRKIVIERTFNLPISTLWKAWTEPESFKKWWGPKPFNCTVCKIDLRVGGKYFNNMKGDGKEFFGTGVYKEIIPQTKLVMSDSFADSDGNIIPPPREMPGEWGKELVITVDLEDRSGKTHMTLTHEGIPTEQYNDCIEGWQGSFNKLESNLKN